MCGVIRVDPVSSAEIATGEGPSSRNTTDGLGKPKVESLGTVWGSSMLARGSRKAAHADRRVPLELRQRRMCRKSHALFRKSRLTRLAWPLQEPTKPNATNSLSLRHADKSDARSSEFAAKRHVPLRMCTKIEPAAVAPRDGAGYNRITACGRTRSGLANTCGEHHAAHNLRRKVWRNGNHVRELQRCTPADSDSLGECFLHVQEDKNDCRPAPSFPTPVLVNGERRETTNQGGAPQHYCALPGAAIWQ